MSRKNFKDPDTGEEFYVSNFSSSFKGGETIYRDKYRKELINPCTGNVLEFIPRPKEDFGLPSLGGKYNPATTEGQAAIKQHFGGRANKFDTKGAGRDEKDQKVGDFKKQIMERAKDGKGF